MTYASQETSRQSGNVVELYKWAVARPASGDVVGNPSGSCPADYRYEPSIGSSRGTLVNGYDGWSVTTQSWSDWRLDDRIQKGVIASAEVVVPTVLRLWIVGSGTAGQVTRVAKTVPGFTPGATYEIRIDQLGTAIGNAVTVPAVPATFPGNQQQTVLSTADGSGNLEVAIEVELAVSGFLFNYTIWWAFSVRVVPDGADPCVEDPSLVAPEDTTVTFNHTSCDSTIVYDGGTYVPAVFTRLSPFTAGSGERRGSEIEISMPRDHEIAQLVRDGAPRAPITCTMYRVHRDTLTDAATPLIGRVRKARYEGPDCIVTIGSIQSEAQQKLPVMITQRGCSHVLYGPFCQLLKSAFTHAGLTVTAVSGNTVTVDGAEDAANGDAHYFDEGVMELADGRQAYIASFEGDALTLKQAVTGLSESDTVTLYAGCRHTGADCIARGNGQNYGGESAMPILDPFDGRGGGLT